MPSKSITDAFVRNVKIPDGISQRQVSYIDTLERGLALVLVVSYGGARSFRAMTYRNGRAVTRKLGTYPTMTVKAARAEARAFWENPGKFEAKAEVGSFKDIAESWLKRYVDDHELRSEKEIRRVLTKYVYPKWEHRPFMEIGRRDVNDLLDDVLDTPRKRNHKRPNKGRTQADGVLAVIRGIMVWHQAKDEHYVCPIVKGMRRNKPKARVRVLNDQEIRSVWDLAGAKFGPFLKICLLTAQRSGDVLKMEWDHLKDGVWTMPTLPRAKPNAGVLKLPPLAREIIENQPRYADNPLVFPHMGSRSKHKSDLDKKLKKRLPEMQPWVIHDLRRTARTLMSRAGVSSDDAERTLGHMKPGVERTYDRYAYLDEKATALKKLNGLIEKITSPPTGNVVALRN